MIELHEAKILSPESFYPEWDRLSEREKQGCVRHWQKEIDTAKTSIQYRIEELEKRGEHYD